jgi:hypothetical protein
MASAALILVGIISLAAWLLSMAGSSVSASGSPAGSFARSRCRPAAR